MDEKDEKYLDLIQNFYSSKNNYLTNKDKYMTCKGCDKNKTYIENKDVLHDGKSRKEIILSCGDKGKCGDKIKIILPKYIYKDKEIQLLKDELEKVIDREIISKYIKIDKDFLEDNRKLLEENNRKILEIKEKYYEVYKKNNVNLINSKYKEILKLKLECTNMKKELNDISLSIEEKKIIRNNYIEHITNINQLYSEIKENIDNVKEYYLEEEPEIILDNLDFIEEDKKKKSKKKKPVKEKPVKEKPVKEKPVEEKDDTIFIEGTKVKWTDKKGNELNGVIEKITASSYKICCKDGTKSGDKGSLYQVSKNIVSKLKGSDTDKPDDKEDAKPEDAKPEDAKPEDKKSVKKLTLDDFKKGMNVSYKDKGVENIGVVKDITDTKVIVFVETKKNMQKVPVKKLTILD